MVAVLIKEVWVRLRRGGSVRGGEGLNTRREERRRDGVG
jgi:hypothetical protein